MPVSKEARARVHRLLEGGVDWSLVLPLATKWRVEPTVFGNLGSEFSAAMPPGVRAELATLEKQSRAYAVSRTLVLMDVVSELARQGIPALVLKGPAIAIMAYDDCSRRIFADADLLVRRDDLGRARDILLGRGYAANFQPGSENALIGGQHALEFSDSRMAVELHWTLLSRHLRFNLNIDHLWDESVWIDCLGSKMRTLASEHHFLYLCAHGAKHEWALFRWICDIAQLSDRLTRAQAEKVVDLAGKAHARRLLAVGLRLVREMFADEVSPFPPGAYGPDRDTAQLVSLVTERLTRPDAMPRKLLPPRIAGIHRYMDPLAFWLASRERITDRVVCAAQFFFLPAAGDSGRSQMQRVFRPIRLAANAMRRIAHAS
jgi:hypothetical protein